MATIAANDIVENINAALAFLRDRLVQAAFGVKSLWALVSIAGAVRGQGDASIRNHVDRGRAGQTVLLWLAAHYTDRTPKLDPTNPGDVEVIGAAQRWLSARPLAARCAARHRTCVADRGMRRCHECRCSGDRQPPPPPWMRGAVREVLEKSPGYRGADSPKIVNRSRKRW